MSSIQDKISESNKLIRYKLFDNNIHLMGKQINVVRFKVVEDMYEDEELTYIKKDPITAIINYPQDIPLYRLSRGDYNQDIEDTGVFLFDIIPFDVFTKWEDKVIKGDYLFHSFKDEEDNPIELLLRISDVVGRFDSKMLIWRKGLCSPYSGEIPTELQEAIDNERNA